MVLAVSSRSGAPHVTVTGPGGVRLRTPRKGALRTRHALIVPFAPTHTTYVFVDDRGRRLADRRRPGDHQGALGQRAAGAQGHRQAAQAGDQARAPTYRVRRIPGQSVRFFEHGTDLDRTSDGRCAAAAGA